MLLLTLSAADNVKLVKPLESGFRRTINWNKCQPELKTLPQNIYLNYLIDPSFQGVNRLLFYRLKMKLTEKYTQNIIFQM